MDQKDSGALIVGSCSYMCKARIAGFMPGCVFPLVAGRPAGRSAWTRSTFTQLADLTGDDVPRAPIYCRQAQDARHHGRYDSRSTENSVLLGDDVIFSVFGSLVRQWMHVYVSLQRPGPEL